MRTKICQLLGVCVAVLSLIAAGCGSESELVSGSQASRQPGKQNPKELPQQVSGSWGVRLGDADYVLELVSHEKALTGFVLAPDHSRHPIFSGAAEAGSFEFKAIEENVEWQWHATISGDTLQGKRQSAAGDQHQTFVAERVQPQPRRQKSAAVGGRWLFRTADNTFTIDLIVEEQGLRGSVASPGEASEPIKIGVFSGDAFLFETSDNGAGWLWAGQFSSSGLRGQRENLQTGAVETFTAYRPE